MNDAVQNRTGNRRRCVHSELESHVGVGSGSPEKAGVTCTNRKCKEEILLWDAIEQKFASDEFKNRVRALREASLISIDNESRELILEGHARTITGQAGQIYRAYTNSDHGIDGLAAPGQSPTWVQFTPYVWATSVKGNMTVNGVTAPMDINLSDLWQLVKNGEVRGGFMGHLAFGRDNWTMFVNGDIVSMDPSAEVRRASIETGLTMTLLELGGAVNLYNADESEPFNSPLRIQMLGGIRYYAVDTSAILSLPTINPLVTIDQSANWVDLFVGSQALAKISSNTDVFVRGDVGGFGIGISSIHAWNFVSGISTNGICGSNLFLGYRVFDLDQSLSGGNGSPQGFGVNEVIHGPVLGLSFRC